MSICLFGSFASAKIGDGAEQIEQRYGKPIESEPHSRDGHDYKYREFFVRVNFERGKSAYEQFHKDKYERLSDDEVTTILELTAPKSQWQWRDRRNEQRRCEEWRLGTTLFAYHDIDHGIMYVVPSTSDMASPL
jgi:hypothetical protein